MKYIVKATNAYEAVVVGPSDGYVECIFIDAPIFGNGVLLESPTGPYAFVRTEAENFDELKADHKACKKFIEKVVEYFGADDSVPSLWHFAALEEANTFAAIFGCYQNPEWGRDIVVEKGISGYVVGEPELF